MKKMIYGIITSIFVVALGLTMDTTSMRTYADSVTLDSKECQEHDIKAVTTRATLKKKGQIVEKCASCGATISDTDIARIKSVKLSKTSYTYNGKVQKPSVVVKDSAGKVISSKHYKITYQKGRKLPGWYKVTVSFKGNYSGTKTLWFKINPKGAKITGGEYNSKSITVNVKKTDKNITGYQVRVARNKAGTAAKFKNSKSSKIKVSGLMSGTNYYISVRTFKNTKKNGKTVKVYSSWSKVIGFKTEGKSQEEKKDEAELCYEMLDLVNEERAKRGLEPYVWGEDLEKGTLVRAKELATLWSHTRPNGKPSGTAFTYRGGLLWEIIADDSKYYFLYGKQPDVVLDAWLASDGHRGTIIVNNYIYAEIMKEDTTFIRPDGSIDTYKAGEVCPGYHDTFKMCCASYKGYWIMTVDIEEEEYYWELEP